jgi:hypothetical protein
MPITVVILNPVNGFTFFFAGSNFPLVETRYGGRNLNPLSWPRGGPSPTHRTKWNYLNLMPGFHSVISRYAVKYLNHPAGAIVFSGNDLPNSKKNASNMLRSFLKCETLKRK